jgi:hypothetical protein
MVIFIANMPTYTALFCDRIKVIYSNIIYHDYTLISLKFIGKFVTAKDYNNFDKYYWIGNVFLVSNSLKWYFLAATINIFVNFNLNIFLLWNHMLFSIKDFMGLNVSVSKCEFYLVFKKALYLGDLNNTREVLHCL